MGRPRLGFGTIAILSALDQGWRFGFDIMDATGLTSGTVYPALERLQDLGLVSSRWEPEATARREGRPARRYFELTTAGARTLAEALDRYPALRPAPRSETR